MVGLNIAYTLVCGTKATTATAAVRCCRRGAGACSVSYHGYLNQGCAYPTSLSCSVDSTHDVSHPLASTPVLLLLMLMLSIAGLEGLLSLRKNKVDIIERLNKKEGRREN